MTTLFTRISHVLNESDRNLIDVYDIRFLNNVNDNLMLDNSEEGHLPVSVFSYIKPTMGIQVLLHIMISMGRFSTEIDLTTHATLRESLRHCQLMGPSDDPVYLEEYSNCLLRRFITEQLI